MAKSHPAAVAKNGGPPSPRQNRCKSFRHFCSLRHTDSARPFPFSPSTERASSCHIGRSATVRKAGHVPGGSPPPIHHFPSAARWIAAFAGFLQTLPSQYRPHEDRKSTRLNSSHLGISYAVFCLKKKKNRK